jgi:hypothetical protein
VFDQMYVGLETENQFMPAHMNVVSSEEAKIVALRKGQTAIFRCNEMKRWVGSPMGSKCVLIGAQ